LTWGWRSRLKVLDVGESTAPDATPTGPTGWSVAVALPHDACIGEVASALELTRASTRGGATSDNLSKRIGIWRIVIGVAAVIFLITRFTSHGTATDTGSCWTHASGVAYKPVSCSSSSATLRVTSETADPSTCPDNGAGYLDSKKDGPTGYRCLEPVTH
jgi:hypothetical protein